MDDIHGIVYVHVICIPYGVRSAAQGLDGVSTGAGGLRCRGEPGPWHMGVNRVKAGLGQVVVTVIVKHSDQGNEQARGMDHHC